MKPEDARQHLSAYLDGALDDATRRQVERALEADAELRAELDALGRLSGMIRSLPRHRAPEGFAARVAEAIAAPEASEPWLRRWRPALIAAAACGALALLTVLVNPSRPREQSRSVDTVAKAPRESAPAERESVARDEKLDAEVKLKEGAADDAVHEAVGRVKDAPAPSAPPRPAPAMTPAPRAVAPDGTLRTRGASRMGQAPGAAGGRAAAPAAPMIVAKSVAAEPEAEAFGVAEAEEGNGIEHLAHRIQRARAAQPAHPVGTKAKKEAMTRREAGATAHREAVVRYTDLRGCLTDITEALRAVGVPYALQPEGAGEFVVETTVTAQQAAALLALLSPRKGQQAEAAAPRKPRPTALAKPAVATQPSRKVHLVIRFQRAGR